MHAGSALRFRNWPRAGHTFGTEEASGQCNKGSVSSSYKRGTGVTISTPDGTLSNCPFYGPSKM